LITFFNNASSQPSLKIIGQEIMCSKKRAAAKGEQQQMERKAKSKDI